jgi:RNA polymerase sigma factor (TIGR02999 family)
MPERTTPAPQEPDPSTTLAPLFAASERGDPEAAAALFAALYDELRRLAQRHVERLGSAVTMSATTLVHEAWLDLAGRPAARFVDRARFFAYASRAMRGLAIDHARSRSAAKRGGDAAVLSLDDAITAVFGDTTGGIDADALHDALATLEGLDARLAELVDLHVFGGLSLVEIAAIRAVSERTVQRDWRKARLVLRQALER